MRLTSPSTPPAARSRLSRSFAPVMLAMTLVLVAAACEPQSNNGPTTKKAFGISSSAWDVDDWAASVGRKPTSLLMFEKFADQRTLDKHFTEIRKQGLSSVTVTWEPWESVPAGAGKDAQYAVQPRWTNATIVRGDHDAYIRRFARSVAASGLKVWMRYGHEMNGDWYPWSRDPANFVKAWRRIVTMFRDEGATNARFVFSVNPNLYQSVSAWKATIAPYWPGADYVHATGSTIINWGGTKEYSVAIATARLTALHDLYGKPVFITEMQTDWDGRVEWLTQMRNWLGSSASNWVVGVNLSQATSRGQAQMGDQVGNLNWRVENDPATKSIVRSIIDTVS